MLRHLVPPTRAVNMLAPMRDAPGPKPLNPLENSHLLIFMPVRRYLPSEGTIEYDGRNASTGQA